MSKENRYYDKEFKMNAIQLVKSSDKSRTQIARDLGIPEATLRQWVKYHDKDGNESFRGKGVVRSSNEELYNLQKELADVKLERDILKKAVAIFSQNKV